MHSKGRLTAYMHSPDHPCWLLQTGSRQLQCALGSWTPAWLDSPLALCVEMSSVGVNVLQDCLILVEACPTESWPPATADVHNLPHPDDQHVTYEESYISGIFAANIVCSSVSSLQNEDSCKNNSQNGFVVQMTLNQAKQPRRTAALLFSFSLVGDTLRLCCLATYTTVLVKAPPSMYPSQTPSRDQSNRPASG